jgi:tetratricopeptide (TPR) repeat protein
LPANDAREAPSACRRRSGRTRCRSVGSFADPSFPPPTESGYDTRRHSWLELPDSIARHDPGVWDAVSSLYQAGEYAQAADRGGELLEEYPLDARLHYNVACCESLAGRRADALEHLARAVEMYEGCRDLARGDSDFDPIRGEPAFAALVGSSSP